MKSIIQSEVKKVKTVEGKSLKKGDLVQLVGENRLHNVVMVLNDSRSRHFEFKAVLVHPDPRSCLVAGHIYDEYHKSMFKMFEGEIVISN